MEFQKLVRVITKVAAGAVVVSTLVGVYVFYLNNIYRPQVTFLSIDEANGVAYLNIRGKDKMVYLNSISHILGDWSVRVAASDINVGSGQSVKVYNRLELLKNNVVYSYIPISY